MWFPIKENGVKGSKSFLMWCLFGPGRKLQNDGETDKEI
jgi:hypothetical protein